MGIHNTVELIYVNPEGPVTDPHNPVASAAGRPFLSGVDTQLVNAMVHVALKRQ